jgi:glycosyltransferase involved in cell wall biosynthesis
MSEPGRLAGEVVAASPCGPSAAAPSAPSVSVVIATRNYGRYVAAAVRSVLWQTWRDLELVVIDDGSTDETAFVLQPLLTDPRVRYIRTDGLGQSPAKNLGVQLSRAPLIAFLDGDDEWLPEKLAKQLPLFADPAVGVVYCRRVLVDGDGRELPARSVELVRGQVYDKLLAQNPVCFSSAIVRRTVFEAVGMFDAKLPLAIDYDLWLRVARHFEFDYVNEPLVCYRTGHANLSSRIVERVTAVLTILQRSLVRRRNAESAGAAAVAEAWGTTCRTMGFVLRDQSPLNASSWYLRAAIHDRRWLATMRAVYGTVERQCKLLRHNRFNKT